MSLCRDLLDSSGRCGKFEPLLANLQFVIENFSTSSREGEALSEGERRLIEEAKSHFILVSTQISRAQRYMGEYRRNGTGENWRRMIAELKALEELPMVPAFLTHGLEHAMKLKKPDGWPTGTKTW